MPTSVEAVRNKGVCKTPLHKAIDYRMPTPVPLPKGRGKPQKATFLMREHTVFYAIRV